MAAYSLSDAQWCVLDLLMKARDRGIELINRQELLANSAIPDTAKLKLTWAALTMPKDLVIWQGEHDFRITPQGVSLYGLRFNRPQRTDDIVATVICLPDRSGAAN